MEESSEDSQTTCLNCGATDFTWGTMHGHSRTRFKPDGPWLTLLSTDINVLARLCDNCGNIQLFANK